MENLLKTIFRTKKYEPSDIDNYRDVKMLVAQGVWKRGIFRKLYDSCKTEEEFVNMYIKTFNKKFPTIVAPYMPTDEELKAITSMNNLFSEYKKVAETEEWNNKSDIAKLSCFTDYSELIKKHAIVARYLLIQGTYDVNAFQHYLRDTRIQGSRTQDEWCTLQAKYCVYLTREFGKLTREQELEHYKTSFDGLKKEFTDFKKEFERAKAVYEERVAARNRDMRARLIAMIEKNKGIATTVGSILKGVQH